MPKRKSKFDILIEEIERRQATADADYEATVDRFYLGKASGLESLLKFSKTIKPSRNT